MATGDFMKEVLPFMSLVAIECAAVGTNTIYKAAILKGMSYQVFMFYDYALAAILLLPAPIFSLRSRLLPPLTLSTLSKIGLLSLIGSSLQICGYKGISYSSPALFSAMSNLTPAFTFIVAIIIRMEKFDITKASTQAKVLGTIVSIVGACVVTLYKGLPVIKLSSSPSISVDQHFQSSEYDQWVIGGVLLTAHDILLPFWFILMTKILEQYPAELTVVFFYDLCMSFITTVIGLLTVRDSSAWRIKPDISLAAIISTALVSSIIFNAVQSWALKIKGPVYVAMFKPFSILIAIVMGVMFLGDTLYLGSVIGAITITLGFYALMWGKAKEERAESDGVNSGLDSASPARQALLSKQSKKESV